MKYTFDLVEEPWIPCTDLLGAHKVLGLRALFAEAHRLRSLALQSPLTEAALFRVLLAVIHRAVDGPKNSGEWKDLYRAGEFDHRLSKYLAKWRHRFDLFSEEAPFYQTPGLLVLDKDGNPSPVPIATLIPERARGDNRTLFDHTTSEVSLQLTPADAALALITAQAYLFGGTNRKTTNLFGFQQNFLQGSLVSGILVMLLGSSLFQSLLLNLLVCRGNEPIPNTSADCPVWERNDIGRTGSTTPKGYLDFLTCKSRQVLLVPSARARRTVVERTHIAQGEAFRDIRDPAVLRKKKRDGDWYCPPLQLERMVWRDSLALFAFEDGTDERPKAFRQVSLLGRSVTLPSRYVCSVYGLANDQAKPLASRREILSVPSTLLADPSLVANLHEAMRLSESGEKILKRSTRIYTTKALPKTKEDVVTEKANATGATETYWDQLEEHFRRYLAMLDDPEAALKVWEDAIIGSARRVLKTCVRSRYRDSARTYRAWSEASANLERGLASL